jgi:nicotinamidase-related amidase
MATEMCVTQTAITARELGFKVTVLAGACACVDERLERIALEYLRQVAGVFVET